MGIREILSQGLKDGVEGFFDSIIEQVNEQSEQSVDEILDKCEEALEEIQELLETIGANGKFDKFDNVHELCGWTLIVASMVSGKGLDDAESEEIRKIRDNSFNDLFNRWKQTRAFLESGVCRPALIILESKIGISNLDMILDSFYEDISVLPYSEKGIFAIRKTRKIIQPYSERVYVVCEIYGKLINVMRNTLK